VSADQSSWSVSSAKYWRAMLSPGFNCYTNWTLYAHNLNLLCSTLCIVERGSNNSREFVKPKGTLWIQGITINVHILFKTLSPVVYAYWKFKCYDCYSIVMCREVPVTKIRGSSSNNWIY
jgi:hypothetical protein